MNKDRCVAFSDGVIAVIITIMVLELKTPHSADWSALGELAPVFLSYVLSFVYVGIYWNNHHHLFQLVHKVGGSVLWPNLHWLFWLSLIPFTTGWIGENHFAPIPMALYGVTLLMSAVAWYILERSIIAIEGPQNSRLAHAVGADLKGKLSPVLYVLGIAAAFVNTWISGAIYVGVALMWLIPDRRIEAAFRSP
jgi:uncharacterized membrane protein